MKQVTLRLEGPMQAWGADGAGQIRRTHPQPQKRTVLGLIRAAKGLARDQSWGELEELEFSCQTIKSGIRMWDFASMSRIISADGSKFHPRGIQEKEYLADSAFTVTLSGNDGLIDEVIEALENPVFLIGLGRRDCMPSQPILMNDK
jgi:CRISPR system Cascade subunit CasD